ncbi:MAG: hypothetical protein ACI9Q3_001397 [Maribacter sp.]|jgi:hypothetical protein
MNDNIKIVSASSVAIIQSFLENLNPFITFFISIITFLYILEKYLLIRQKRKNEK